MCCKYNDFVRVRHSPQTELTNAEIKTIFLHPKATSASQPMNQNILENINLSYKGNAFYIPY